MSKIIKNFLLNSVIVGLDISDRSVEVMQVDEEKNVLSYGGVSLPAGLVEDGKILQPVELAEQIKTLLSSAKPKALTPSKKLGVILSLPESRVSIHHLEIAELDIVGSDLDIVVLQEASKVLSVNLNDLYWDYLEVPNRPQIISEDEKQPQTTREVLFVCAPKNIVDDYVKLMEMVGVDLISIDIESLSLGRSVIEDKINTVKSGKLVIDLGARTTIVSVFDSNHYLNLAINIPLAGEFFTENIVKKLNISKDEAEVLKRSFGFDTAKPDNQVLPILQTAWQKINHEIGEAIDYYEQTTNEKISEIILAGGSALLPKLSQYLSTTFSKPVVLSNPWSKINNAQIFNPSVPAVLFANVAGLALSGKVGADQNINLLKKRQSKKAVVAESKKISINSQKIKWLLFFAVVFILIISFIVLSYQNLSKSFSDYKKPKTVNQPVVTEQPKVETEVVTEQAEPLASGSTVDIKVVEEAMSEVLANQEPAVVVEQPAVVEQPKVEVVAPVIKEVTIKNTPTGWLNVRSGPGTTYPKITKIYPQKKYQLLEEKGSWVKLQIDDKTQGWVSAQYVQK